MEQPLEDELMHLPFLMMPDASSSLMHAPGALSSESKNAYCFVPPEAPSSETMVPVEVQ